LVAVFAALLAAVLAGAFAAGAFEAAFFAAVSGTAFTGRAFFSAGFSAGATVAVVVRRAVLAAGTAEALAAVGVERGVVTGDTDDLPCRWRGLSDDREAASTRERRDEWGHARVVENAATRADTYNCSPWPTRWTPIGPRHATSPPVSASAGDLTTRL
jgi:hypothetical protein